MFDTILAYLISLGIIGAGIGWIVCGVHSANAALWISIGVATIAVGALSTLTELRDRTR